MPDIMIRGISLPEGELKYVTLWVYGDGRVYVSNNASAASSQRLQDLAVPLPEGHGKLIDIKDVKSGKFHIEGRAEMYSAYNTGWNDALDAVCMNAPSIVPAEGGVEE